MQVNVTFNIFLVIMKQFVYVMAASILSVPPDQGLRQKFGDHMIG